MNNLESLYNLTYQWLTVDRIADIDDSPTRKSKSPVKSKIKPPRSPEKAYNNVSHLANPLYKPPR